MCPWETAASIPRRGLLRDGPGPHAVAPVRPPVLGACLPMAPQSGSGRCASGRSPDVSVELSQSHPAQAHRSDAAVALGLEDRPHLGGCACRQRQVGGVHGDAADQSPPLNRAAAPVAAAFTCGGYGMTTARGRVPGPAALECWRSCMTAGGGLPPRCARVGPLTLKGPFTLLAHCPLRHLAQRPPGPWLNRL